MPESDSLAQEETFDGNQDWRRTGVLMTSGSEDLTVEQGRCFGGNFSSACPCTVIMWSVITSSFKSSAKHSKVNQMEVIHHMLKLNTLKRASTIYQTLGFKFYIH